MEGKKERKKETWVEKNKEKRKKEPIEGRKGG